MAINERLEFEKWWNSLEGRVRNSPRAAAWAAWLRARELDEAPPPHGAGRKKLADPFTIRRGDNDAGD